MFRGIYDSHTHYDDSAFDEDRDELIDKMLEPNGPIRYLVNVGANLDESKISVEMAEKNPRIYATVGVHPDCVEELSDEGIEQLRKLALNSDKVIAIGEIGLDYSSDDVPRQVQKDWFTRQIELAREVNLPIAVHSRDASEDTLNIIRESKAQEIGGVIHCYSYSAETAMIYDKMGFYFGIGGVSTFKNARKLVEAIEVIPMDKIILETDAPYLAPVPNRGKRNDSRNLRYVVEKLAELKGLSPEQVIDITRANAMRLFNRVDYNFG